MPINGAAFAASIEAALEQAKTNGVDMSLVERGVWGRTCCGAPGLR
jgi:hypothetical protein